MERKSYEQLQKRHNEILEQMMNLEDNAAKENRDLNAEELREYAKLEREDTRIGSEMNEIASTEQREQMKQKKDRNVQLREMLQEIKGGKRSNTLTLAPKSTPDGTSITESGAVPLHINDVIDTQVEGQDAVKVIKILTGVVGDNVWPISADDVVVSVAGETADTTKQALSFTNIKASSERVSVAVAVSDRAIANAAFDLVSFVAMKIRKALNIMLAKRMFSHAQWNDTFKGPFSLVTPGTITKGNGFAKAVAMGVAEIADRGFTGNPIIVIDKVTEAELKYTPANDFAGNTKAVIEDGKLAGFDYVTTSDINGTLNGEGEYVKETDRYLGIGYFDQLQVQQHDAIDFSVDNTSAAVKGAWSTVFTLNAAFSATELSQKINGNNDNKPKAFALYKIVAPSA